MIYHGLGHFLFFFLSFKQYSTIFALLFKIVVLISRNKFILLFLIISLISFFSFVYLDSTVVSTSISDTIKYTKIDSIEYVKERKNPSIEEDFDLNKINSFEILVFKNENSIEVWGMDENELPHLLKVDNFEIEQDFPIGIFDINYSDLQYVIAYPNDFYARKIKKKSKYWLKEKIKLNNSIALNDALKYFQTNENQPLKLVISPNDPRKSGNIEPCIRCPYWYNEIYGSLETEINQFVMPTVIYPVNKKEFESKRVHS